jgi:hypothetical protein
VGSCGKSKRYVKFTVTVVNKSDKSIDIGRTYISVQSRNKDENQLFDSVSGLKGVPDRKVLKGRASQFDVGFGVADPKDVAMELTLHDHFKRPGLHYSTEVRTRTRPKDYEIRARTLCDLAAATEPSRCHVRHCRDNVEGRLA